MARELTNRLDATHLSEGESWLGAQAMSLKGRRGLTAWLADEGRDALTHFEQRHGADQEITIADCELPTGLIMVMSDRRLLAFSRSFTGRPRELMAHWPIGDVSLDYVDRGDRVQARLFVFGLAGGSVFAGEAGVNGVALDKSNAFIDAFHALSTR